MKEHDFFMVQFSYKHSREIIKPILAILHKINVHFFKKNSEILPVGVGLPEWSHSVSLISVPLTFFGGAIGGIHRLFLPGSNPCRMPQQQPKLV